MNMSISKLILCLAVASSSRISPQSMAYAQVSLGCESTIPHDYDSGVTSSATTGVSQFGSPWIQLDLSQTELASTAKLILTGRSASQELDAAALDANGYSAEFDGDFVGIELVTTPRIGKIGGMIRGGSPTSRVIISALRVGLCESDPIASTICGLEDDREPSADFRIGRVGGCTGWLISENVFVQAGHCGRPSTSTRMHFTFGTGSAPAEDQYAVDVESYRGIDQGRGADWGVGRLLPNSAGRLPGVVQEEKCQAAGEEPGCGWFTIGTIPQSTNGNNVRVTGYGRVDNDPDSRDQKTHMDSLTGIRTTSLLYVPDTTGGNSGSPVVDEANGHAIGVHTHGGCNEGGNEGTRIDRPDFAAHIDFLTKSCTQDSDCTSGDTANGSEVCDENGQCQFGSAPTPAPIVFIACTRITNKRECVAPNCSWSNKNKRCSYT